MASPDLTIVRKALVLFFALSPIVTASQEGWRVFQQDEGFTLALPSDWGRIPKDELEAMNEFVRKSNKSSFKVVPYAYGFRPVSPNGTGYPYVFVTVNHGSAPSVDGLRRMSSENIYQGVDVNTATGGQVSDATLNRGWFDESRYTTYIESLTTIRGVGPVRNFTAVKPFSNGWLTVYGYERANEYPLRRDLFIQMVESLTFSPALAYQPPGWTQKLRSSVIVEKALIGAVIGAIVGLIMMAIQRARGGESST